MDALAQLAPVAAPLLRDVDRALLTLGAPPTHPALPALGRVGSTPSAVVAFAAELEPSRLRQAATALREQATAYEQASIPTQPPGEGELARRYAATATAVRDHLAGPADSLAARLRDQASYVESLAAWQQELRESLARALARVMTCGQAVTVRSYATRPDDVANLKAAVEAAADIAAVLLGVAEDAAAAGRAVVRSPRPLDELPYRSSAPSDPIGPASTIRLD